MGGRARLMGVLMTRLAAILLALACAVLLTPVSAQRFQPLRPLLRPVQQAPSLNLRQNPPPARFSRQQLSAELAKNLGLMFPPTVGEPISITPAHPGVGGIASLAIYGAHSIMISPYDQNGQSNLEGMAFVDDTAAGKILLNISAQGGKRYAVDCRFATGLSTLYYSIKTQDGTVSGQTAFNGAHALFATAPIANTQWILVTMTLSMNFRAVDEYGAPFWGCDVVPF